MTMFLGTMDIRVNNRAPGLQDLSWYKYANRIERAHRPWHERWSGTRTSQIARLRWPMRGGIMGTDAGYTLLGQGPAANWMGFGWLREIVGSSSTKVFNGRVVDSGGNGVSGATVQGFRTSDDLFVGEVQCDSAGYFQLPTPYPGVAHYLVAYLDTATDKTGASINTLIPTNTDGT